MDTPSKVTVTLLNVLTPEEQAACKHLKTKIGYNDGTHSNILCATCEADLGWIGGHPRWD